jgi:heat shock protein HtpX
LALDKTISFVIDTEITPAFFDELLKFIQRYYISRLGESSTNVRRTIVDNEYALSFRAFAPEKTAYVDVEIRAGRPIKVRMRQTDEQISKEDIARLKEDLIITIQWFEEYVRKTALYFAWVEGEKVIPEKPPQRSSNIIYKLFSESMLLLFVIFIVASIFFFIIFGLYAPILLVAVQLIIVLFSDKIIIRTGEWRITKENPSVHILQYYLAIKETEDFQQRLTQETLVKLKKEIYEKTFAVGKPLNIETCTDALSKHGFECRPENMAIKKVNVYEIIKKVAGKFSLPIPKIAIANTLLPNAAASGLSPNRGVVVITTGLLVQLEDDEIESVVGHEFGHLRGRDPLVLFALTSFEFLLRVYVFWPLLFSSYLSLYFGYLYLFIAFSVVYFIAKFFEGRADLDSAIKIGQPKVLAEALRKIGFRRLSSERIPSYRFREWIGWDPHPPIYFRVARLEKLESPEKIKHPLIQSMKDNIRGFLDTIG